MTLSPAVQQQVFEDVFKSVFTPRNVPGKAASSIPEAYREAAQAKLRRDKESFEEFRKVDQALFDAERKQALKANIRDQQEEIRLIKVDLAELEPDAEKALAVFRLAEEHAGECEAYAQERREAYEPVKGDHDEYGRPPGEVVEAEIRVEKADRLAVQARADADRLKLELADAAGALADAEERLAEAESHLAELKRWTRTTIPAPIPEVTQRECAAYLQWCRENEHV